MCNIFSKTSKTDKEQIAELKSNYEELLNYVKCLKLSDLQDVSGCLKPNLGDVLTYTGRIWNSLQSGVDIENTPVQKITYAQLYNLYENKQLIPGQFYEITDYVTKCIGSVNGTQISSAEHPFNIIVQATSNSTLNHNAKATPRENDTYFTYPALEAMEIKYDIDGQNFPYCNGNGWIYYMKDQFGNEANYDFKNLLFIKNNVTSYTFNEFVNDQIQDFSLSGHCSNNKIINLNPQSLSYTTFQVTTPNAYVLSNTVIHTSNNGTVTLNKSSQFNIIVVGGSDLSVTGNYNTLTNCSGIILGDHNVIQGQCDMYMKRDNFEGFNISRLEFDNYQGDIPILQFYILPKGIDGSISRLKVRYIVDSYGITTEKFFTNIHYYEGNTLSIPMNINQDALEDYNSDWEVITIQISIMDGNNPVITQSYQFFNEE